QVDGGAYDGDVAQTVEVHDEGLVDLHLRDGQLLEVRERRLADAEVIHREVNAGLAQLGQHLFCAHRVGHDGRLRDLQREVPQREPRFFQEIEQAGREAWLVQVARRQVHGDAEV